MVLLPSSPYLPHMHHRHRHSKSTLCHRDPVLEALVRSNTYHDTGAYTHRTTPQGTPMIIPTMTVTDLWEDGRELRISPTPRFYEYPVFATTTKLTPPVNATTITPAATKRVVMMAPGGKRRHRHHRHHHRRYRSHHHRDVVCAPGRQQSWDELSDISWGSNFSSTMMRDGDNEKPRTLKIPVFEDSSDEDSEEEWMGF